MKSLSWHFFTNDPVLRPGSNPTPLPTRAMQLANGNVLISDQFNNQVIEVNEDNARCHRRQLLHDQQSRL